MSDNVEQQEQPNRPERTSPEWNDYVMSQFHESELRDGRPLVAGLRRVTQLLLGEIMSSECLETKFIETRDRDTGRAISRYRVSILFPDGMTRTYSDVADCWDDNTDDEMCPFAVAFSATRAETRALRKALGLKTASAEEMTKKDTKKSGQRSGQKTDPEWTPERKISDSVINLINRHAKELDVDVMKFINMGEKTYSSIQEVSKSVGAGMMTLLTDYKNKHKDIPDNIRGYDPGWNKD